MVMQVIAWILLAIGVIAMLARRPVRNCHGCVWAIGGHCGHSTASQVPELVEIQTGMWRCPWREVGKPWKPFKKYGSDGRLVCVTARYHPIKSFRAGRTSER